MTTSLSPHSLDKSPIATTALGLLGTHICKTLCEKTAEKRKVAALEVEQWVKNCLTPANRDVGRLNLQRLLEVLNKEFLDAPSAQVRKGGLLALASTSIGVGSFLPDYIDTIVRCTLRSFNDPNPRVRYYACEALYNITKVARGLMMPYLADTLECLCIVVIDVDTEVAQGTVYVDRLLQDIVSQHFNGSKTNTAEYEKSFERVVEMLRTSSNPTVRSLLLRWTGSLSLMLDGSAAVREIATLLPILVKILREEHLDNRTAADNLLSKALGDLKVICQAEQAEAYDLKALLIVVVQEWRESDDSLPQVTVISWLQELLALLFSESVPAPRAGVWCRAFLAETSMITQVILGALASVDDEIVGLGRSCHTLLVNLIHKTHTEFPDAKDLLDVGCLVGVLKEYLHQETRDTKITFLRNDSTSAALQLITMLMGQRPNDVLKFSAQIFPMLLSQLSHPKADVVQGAAQVLGQMACYGDTLEKLAEGLMELFHSNRYIMEESGKKILLQLCSLVDTGRLFALLATLLPPPIQSHKAKNASGTLGWSPRAPALSLAASQDVEFKNLIVQLLNWILFTAPETEQIRRKLRTSEGTSLFQILIVPWLNNPVSALTICLFAGYENLSLAIVRKLGNVETGLDFFLQLDQLVQLLESSVFTNMRLNLLCAAEHPYLLQSYLSIAMLLPQTASTYSLVENRLRVIRSGVPMSGDQRASEWSKETNNNELEMILSILDDVIAAHKRYIRNDETTCTAADILRGARGGTEEQHSEGRLIQSCEFQETSKLSEADIANLDQGCPPPSVRNQTNDDRPREEPRPSQVEESGISPSDNRVSQEALY